jgi:hypothetical protein
MRGKQVKAVVIQRLLDEGVREKLEQMAASETFNTTTSYSPDTQSYPDHQMPFADKHIDYLLSHPKINSEQYLANLRMRTRSR